MKQKELIMEYIREQGSILPAKMAGYVYKGEMFGSETSKRCRELRGDGELDSRQEGKFERFYLPGTTPRPPKQVLLTSDQFIATYGPQTKKPIEQSVPRQMEMFKPN